MATYLQISCINKTNRYDVHARIASVGGLHQDGSRWKLSEDTAIVGIENGSLSFYVSAAGRTVAVEIARSAEGHKYLKTVADYFAPDNLLNLPECPP